MDSFVCGQVHVTVGTGMDLPAGTACWPTATVVGVVGLVEQERPATAYGQRCKPMLAGDRHRYSGTDKMIT